MSKDLIEIHNRIITLFDYYYNKSVLDDYEVMEINPDKITLDHIKICNKDDAINILKEIKMGKIKTNGFHDNILSLIRYHDTFPITIKISEYKNSKEIKDINSGANRDSFFAFLFGNKVLNNQINLVELPIVNFDIEFSKIKDILTSYPEVEYFEENIENKKISNIVNLRLRERFFKSKTLLEHLEQSQECNLKDILVQICLTLAQIENYYPKFKHNNLNLNGINLYYKKDKGETKRYYIGNDEILYRSPGFELKIGNFENATLDPVIINKKYSNINDLYNFVKNLKENEYFSKIKCDKISLDIIDKVLDKKISAKINSMDSISPISPRQIVKTLTKDTRKINVEKVHSNSHDYYLGKNKIKIKGKLSREMGNVDFMDKKLVRKYRNSKKQKNSKTNKQKGGAPVMLPAKKNEFNNPGLSNDNRTSYNKYKNDKPKPRPPPEPKKLVEQTIYQQDSNPPPKKQNPMMYPPVHVPATHPSYRIPLPYQYDINKLPIQNIYNVSLADPRGDHSRLARIFEDITPGKEFGLSTASIYDRNDSSNYIKSIMVNNEDGVDVSLTGGDGSLLEHIKLMEINPYYYTNPYSELPKNNFLLYTSAYPIRYNEEKGGIQLAKNSVSINLRMYGLTNEELLSHKSGGVGSRSDHNPWLELEYYMKINDLLKKKTLTPNFAMMHFWVLDRESRIRYDEIENIKNQKNINIERIRVASQIKEKTDTLVLQKIESIISNERMKVFRELNLLNYIKNRLIPLKLADEKSTGTDDERRLRRVEITNNLIDDLGRLLELDDSHNENMKEIINIINIDMTTPLTEDSKVSLGIITESPTHTFTRWGSAIYNGSGSLKTMSQTGYHNHKVYESMLFQYTYAMAVLQKHNIRLNNFNMYYNLFVKDIYTDAVDSKHWVYKVNGVKYYVPNYGFVGMIDSFYGGPDLANPNDPKFNFEDSDKNRKGIHTDFRTLLNRTNYEANWKRKGGHQVPKEFLDLIDRMSNCTSTNIVDYFKYFKNLLNNKIGRPISISDMSSIDLTRMPRSLNNGAMVARRDASDSCYKWAVILGKIADVDDDCPVTKYLVQTDIDKNPIEISSSQLYTTCEVIDPEPVNGVRFDGSNRLETYELSTHYV